MDAAHHEPAIQAGLGRGHRLLLLFEVVLRVRLLGLQELLAGLLDLRLLRGDLLLGSRLHSQRELLCRLVDGVLGLLDFFVLRAGDKLLDVLRARRPAAPPRPR